jgi:hypothetical protein
MRSSVMSFLDDPIRVPKSAGFGEESPWSICAASRIRADSAADAGVSRCREVDPELEAMYLDVLGTA